MLGLILSAFAALCFGISTAYQKYCMIKMPHFSLKKLISNKQWVLSVLLGFTGILAYLMALKYESISLVQPMLSISIIITIAIGWLKFHERIDGKWAYLMLIIAGVLLLTL